jgi:hypothetical protein
MSDFSNIIKLLAIDLDGTLLNSRKQITSAAVECITHVREKLNVEVVLSTARPPRSTLPFYRQLELDGPMINYNGALVWEPPTGRVLMHRPIPVNITRGIIRWARQRFEEIRVSAEVMDKWFTDYYDRTYQTETAKAYQPDVVAPIDEWLHEPITKLLLLGKPEWLLLVDEAIRQDLHREVTTVQTEDFLLQVMHASVSKAEALRAVAAERKVRREEVMAIGDNANDAGMIHWAGIGVAMANGHISSLQVADHVADHHDAEGVSGVIRELLIDGQSLADA